LLEPKISLLCYPEFFESPHPELHHSITVDLVKGKARKHDYQDSVNPPILHRKETLLPPEHPLIGKFQRLTEAEEAEGLYTNSRTIGFKLNWESLLAEKGLGYSGIS
jgi:DNA phosphorothioation-associated putative methyltransferase